MPCLSPPSSNSIPFFLLFGLAWPVGTFLEGHIVEIKLREGETCADETEARKENGFLKLNMTVACGTRHGTRFWINLEPCGLFCGSITWFLLAFGMYATTVREDNLIPLARSHSLCFHGSLV
eukprot:scaffold8522_cov157-Ochromonas_danica.AAC.5